MGEKEQLTVEQEKDIQNLFDSIAGSWWAKLDFYSKEVAMYGSLFSVLAAASKNGLFDTKFPVALSEFLEDIKKEEECETCLLFNSEEMSMMKHLRWLLEKTCETERQLKITFEVKSRIIKKRCFYRSLFGNIKTKIRTGDYECHKSIKDLLKKIQL